MSTAEDGDDSLEIRLDTRPLHAQGLSYEGCCLLKNFGPSSVMYMQSSSLNEHAGNDDHRLVAEAHADFQFSLRTFGQM